MVNFVLLAGFFADPAKGMVDFSLKKTSKIIWLELMSAVLVNLAWVLPGNFRGKVESNLSIRERTHANGIFSEERFLKIS